MKHVLLIIPAYNEESNIKRAVETVQTHLPECDFIVINDGSTDRTAEICRQEGFPIVDLPINLGLSGAFRTGMKYAKRHGYDYTMQFDGDGQHRTDAIMDMVDLANRTGADIVIGSRYISKPRIRSLRMLGGYLIRLCIRLTTGKTICDATSGMRLYNKRMIAIFADSNNFFPEPDTIAYLLRCGARVKEYPVEMNERHGGKSYLNPIRSLQYMCNVCISILVMQWFRSRKEYYEHWA